jgi:hypothetical protein
MEIRISKRLLNTPLNCQIRQNFNNNFHKFLQKIDAGAIIATHIIKSSENVYTALYYRELFYVIIFIKFSQNFVSKAHPYYLTKTTKRTMKRHFNTMMRLTSVRKRHS